MGKAARQILIIGQVMQEVFSNGAYLLFAAIASAIVFLFAVWFPNFRLIGEVLNEPNASLYIKGAIFLNLIPAIQTNFSILSRSYTIATALLFGMNVSMIVYYVRKRKAALGERTMAVSIGGMISGVLGIGCAACGSFILTTLLSFIGASGAITLFPLQGGEFGIISIGLLILSISLIAKSIHTPLVCKKGFLFN